MSSQSKEELDHCAKIRDPKLHPKPFSFHFSPATSLTSDSMVLHCNYSLGIDSQTPAADVNTIQLDRKQFSYKHHTNR